VLLDLRRTSDALPHLERAVELAPSDESAQGRWVVGLFLAGRKEEAFAALDRAVARSPEFARRLPDFARVASALGLTELANAALARSSAPPR
jgi:tetratricopeptide (TPR) repeat protein